MPPAQFAVHVAPAFLICLHAVYRRQFMLIVDSQDPDQYPRFRKALIVQLINVLLNRALLLSPLLFTAR